MSDRVAVFNEGVVQQPDTPVNIYEKPLNSFVAQFIGENNKLVGTIIKESKGSTGEIRNGKQIKVVRAKKGLMPFFNSTRKSSSWKKITNS